MEIKTKFNVGQKVYKPKGLLSLRFAMRENKELYEELEIKRIDISVKFIPAIQKDVAEIKYLFSGSRYGIGCDYWVEEKDLFSTKEEAKEQAQAECDKRNKGE